MIEQMQIRQVGREKRRRSCHTTKYIFYMFTHNKLIKPSLFSGRIKIKNKIHYYFKKLFKYFINDNKKTMMLSKPL